MSATYFRFKQFTVCHGQCAMKVGTDGVTLGAWAECQNAENILDAGCGSGLIALMLAQRNATARITAIDIDGDAVKQSNENFCNSPWADRLNAMRADIRSWNTSLKFDLIVSNPPYFVNSLKAPDRQRDTARHARTMTCADLMAFAQTHLTATGRMSIILPTDNARGIISAAHQYDMQVCHKTSLFTSTKATEPKRTLLELRRKEFASCATEEQTLTIGTDEYRNLVKDFYL